jgi:hypothetical protein
MNGNVSGYMIVPVSKKLTPVNGSWTASILK